MILMAVGNDTTEQFMNAMILKATMLTRRENQQTNAAWELSVARWTLYVCVYSAAQEPGWWGCAVQTNYTIYFCHSRYLICLEHSHTS